MSFSSEYLPHSAVNGLEWCWAQCNHTHHSNIHLVRLEKHSFGDVVVIHLMINWMICEPGPSFETPPPPNLKVGLSRNQCTQGNPYFPAWASDFSLQENEQRVQCTINVRQSTSEFWTTFMKPACKKQVKYYCRILLFWQQTPLSCLLLCQQQWQRPNNAAMTRKWQISHHYIHWISAACSHGWSRKEMTPLRFPQPFYHPLPPKWATFITCGLLRLSLMPPGCFVSSNLKPIPQVKSCPRSRHIGRCSPTTLDVLFEKTECRVCTPSVKASLHFLRHLSSGSAMTFF